MIRSFVEEDLEAVRLLLLRYGWTDRASDPASLKRIITSATKAVVAVVDGEIIGFGRCLSDHTSNGYLSMIVVAEESRREGWGRAIVEQLMGDDASMTWVLRAGHPDSAPFWETIGFQRSSIAFERQRRS